MLYHRIKLSVGTAQRQGKIFHGYKAACGAPIISLAPLAVGSTVASGPEPHAQCAACFADQQEHREVELLDDPLSAPVYDEHGRKLDAVREREPGQVQRTERMSPVQDSNGLGQCENRPYG